MCGRFNLRTSTAELAGIFQTLPFRELPPRYNIAPTQPVLAVRQSDLLVLLASVRGVKNPKLGHYPPEARR